MILFKMKFDLGTPPQALEITIEESWVMLQISGQGGVLTSANIRRDHFDAFVAAYLTQWRER